MASRAAAIASQVVISLAIALLVAEIVERWVQSTPSPTSISKGRYRLAENTSIGYEPIPNMRAVDSSVSFMDYNETSNRMGFRDYDHEVSKSDVFRIIVLGDSVTSGHHIKHFKQAFSWLTEKFLNKRGRKVEVLNFGVNGYNTQQEVELLRDRGLQFSPDMVILAYCLNDRVRSDGGLLQMLVAAARSAGVAWSQTGTFLDKSELFQFASYRYQMRIAISNNYKQLNEDRVDTYFGEFAKLALQHNFRPLVAILPDFRDMNTTSPKGDHIEVAQLAEKHHLNSLQLLPVVQACKAQGAGRLHHDLYHPNNAGHACIARGLADEISKTMSK